MQRYKEKWKVESGKWKGAHKWAEKVFFLK